MGAFRRHDAIAQEEEGLLRAGAVPARAPSPHGAHPADAAPRRRPGGCVLPVLLAAALAAGGWYAYDRLDLLGGRTCQMRSGQEQEKRSAEQAANAATITTVGVLRRGLPDDAAHIAVATSIQESKLRNLPGGDRDSLGLFQQRPSQGWGTREQIGDPVYASGRFYDRLVEVRGWQTRPLTEVAQEVQRSGFPEAYADHEAEAEVITAPLTGSEPEGVGCRLDDPTAAGSPARLSRTMRRETGLAGRVADDGVVVRTGSTKTAWAVAAWAITHAEDESITRVTVGDREWVRSRSRSAWGWQDAARPTAGGRTVRITQARP